MRRNVDAGGILGSVRLSRADCLANFPTILSPIRRKFVTWAKIFELYVGTTSNYSLYEVKERKISLKTS